MVRNRQISYIQYIDIVYTIYYNGFNKVTEVDSRILSAMGNIIQIKIIVLIFPGSRAIIFALRGNSCKAKSAPLRMRTRLKGKYRIAKTLGAAKCALSESKLCLREYTKHTLFCVKLTIATIKLAVAMMIMNSSYVLIKTISFRKTPEQMDSPSPVAWVNIFRCKSRKICTLWF